MQFKPLIHPAEESGYWAEVPEIPGCMTQGETLEELHANLQEAIAGCLAVELPGDGGAKVDWTQRKIRLQLGRLHRQTPSHRS